MTPIDDLNVGDIVCVVDYKGPKHCRHCGDFSGHPHTIEAISLPFLALDDGNENHSLDVRIWAVKRVSQEYAAAMFGGNRQERRPRAKPQKIDPMTCPRCHDRYIERLAIVQQANKTKKNEWRWWCRTCHHDGGPANKRPNQERA